MLFVMQTNPVLCQVDSTFLYRIKVKFQTQGRAMFQSNSGSPGASLRGARGVCDERSSSGTERSEYCRQRHDSNTTHSRISGDTANTANRNSALSAVGKYPSLGEALQLTATSTCEDVRSWTPCYRMN